MQLVMINDYLPYIGMLVTLTAWRCERFNTKPLAINLAMIVFNLIWLSLYLADHNPNFSPTSGSVAARVLIVIAEFLIVAYVHSVTRKIHLFKKTIAAQDKQLATLKGINHGENLSPNRHAN